MPYLMAIPGSASAGILPRMRTTPRGRLRGIPRARRPFFGHLTGATLRGLGQISSLATTTSGTITAAQAVTQAIQMAGNVNLNPSFLQNQAGLQTWYGMIEAGQFDESWVSPSCSGIIAKNPDLSLTQAAGTIAGTATGVAAAAAGGTPAAIVAGTASTAGVVLGAATLGIGIVVAILSVIFAHHAQAVAQEQELECTATAAANNSLNVLAEGVQSGQISPTDAATALNTLYSNYAAMVKPSWGTSPYCNANCELQILMQAMVLYWQSQFTAMAAAQAPAAGSSAAGSNVVTAEAENLATSTGLPVWAFYLAGGLLAYKLLFD